MRKRVFFFCSKLPSLLKKPSHFLLSEKVIILEERKNSYYWWILPSFFSPEISFILALFLTAANWQMIAMKWRKNRLAAINLGSLHSSAIRVVGIKWPQNWTFLKSSCPDELVGTKYNSRRSLNMQHVGYIQLLKKLNKNSIVQFSDDIT